MWLVLMWVWDFPPGVPRQILLPDVSSQQNNIDTNLISLEYSPPLGLPFPLPALPARAGCVMKPLMGYDKQRASAAWYLMLSFFGVCA